MSSARKILLAIMVSQFVGSFARASCVATLIELMRRQREKLPGPKLINNQSADLSPDARGVSCGVVCVANLASAANVSTKTARPITAADVNTAVALLKREGLAVDVGGKTLIRSDKTVEAYRRLFSLLVPALNTKIEVRSDIDGIRLDDFRLTDPSIVKMITVRSQTNGQWDNMGHAVIPVKGITSASDEIILASNPDLPEARLPFKLRPILSRKGEGSEVQSIFELAPESAGGDGVMKLGPGRRWIITDVLTISFTPK